MTPRAAEVLTAPPTLAATSRHRHSPRKNARSPRRSAAESLSSPYSSVRHRRRVARQHVADKGHGEAALRGGRGLIQRIEQLVEKPHVARIAPPQPLPGLIRELEAAQARAQLERG